jgi:hypothetical protein
MRPEIPLYSFVGKSCRICSRTAASACSYSEEVAEHELITVDKQREVNKSQVENMEVQGVSKEVTDSQPAATPVKKLDEVVELPKETGQGEKQAEEQEMIVEEEREMKEGLSCKFCDLVFAAKMCRGCMKE